MMVDIMNSPRSISNLVYMNFDINTYKNERSYCFNLFKDKKWVTNGSNLKTMNGRRHFLQEIRNHKFVLCPRGNGIDTHRLWETLYMGSIPIVIKEDALIDFNTLPILFIEKWTDITEDFLNAKYDEFQCISWNMEKLRFSYWKNIIYNSICSNSIN